MLAPCSWKALVIPQAMDLSLARPKTSAFFPVKSPMFHSPWYLSLDCSSLNIEILIMISEIISTYDSIGKICLYSFRTPETRNLHGMLFHGSGTLYNPTRGPMVTDTSATG